MYPVTLTPEAQRVWSALANPQAIRDITSKMQGYGRLSNILLPNRISTVNGGIFVDENQPTPKPAKGVEVIATGAAYPTSNLDEVNAVFKKMQLVGRAAEISLDRLRQNLWLSVDRAMKQVVFGVGQYRDLHTFATLLAAKNNMHQITGTSWATIKDGKPIEQIMAACQAIEDMELGYVPDRLVLPSKSTLKLSTSTEIMALIKHFKAGNDAVTFDGQMLTLPGYQLQVVTAPKSSGLEDPMVLASNEIGGQAYHEVGPDAPSTEREYAQAGVNASAKWYGRDSSSPNGHTNVWYIAADDEINPFVDQPKAGAVITGTA